MAFYNKILEILLLASVFILISGSYLIFKEVNLYRVLLFTVGFS